MSKSIGPSRLSFLFASAAASAYTMSSLQFAGATETNVPANGTPFENFVRENVKTQGAVIATWRKGSGPPLLLLHGYPETHFTWHKIADHLSRSFTVVLADLRGYGDSSKPEGGARHENYSFRAMAQDQVEVMHHFGHESFFVASHDRGARVAHRMCLDHPQAVRKVLFMDIIPTLHMYGGTNQEFATKYFWWFFLPQKAPLPERMIGDDSSFYMDQQLGALSATPGAITPEAVAEYKRVFTSQTIHASCEDFRASEGIDLEMDAAAEKAGRKIECPVLALWGTKGTVGQLWNVLGVWREHARGSVEGRGLNCGHFLQEEQPEEVLNELQRFLTA